MHRHYFLAVLALLAACTSVRAPESRPVQPAASAILPPAPPRPVPVDDKWIELTLRSLSVREKAAQLVFPRISGAYLAIGSAEYQRLHAWVAGLGIGGVIITHGPPLEQASRLNILQSLARVPLLVTADMEHGPGQILQSGTILPYGMDNGGATRFPPLMGFGAAQEERFAYELGRVTALEGRAVGVHMTFGPVVDVNNNSSNPIINTRSYGEDPARVAKLAAAHIRGIQDHGMLATAKHFPGHGDTGTDSHLDLPIITVDRQRADRMELPPYRSAVDAGVAAIMTAHIAFPALTGDSLPATLNHKVLTGLLREELAFRGLIITDAMDMGAIRNLYGNTRAAVLALQAGADVLLQPLPQDVPPIIDAIVQAVQGGQLSEARLDQALRKLLAAKTRVGLHLNRYVDIAAIPAQLAIPPHLASADAIAEHSITAVRDRDKLLPLRGPKVVSVIYSDDFDPFTGRILQRSLSAVFPQFEGVQIDGRTTRAALDSLLAYIDPDATVLFSPFILVRDSKNSVAIPAEVADFVSRLNEKRRLVVTSFGNPYVLTQFPQIGTYVLAWGQWDVMQRAAARALTGQIPITGKLPISIPPLHQLGEGLRIESLAGGRK